MIGESANQQFSESVNQRINLPKKGFTLVELLLVMGILGVLFSIMTISYFGTQGKNLLVQGADILVADMRSQQTKAMAGSTPTSATAQAGYGIHFDDTSYTLFTGDTFTSGAATNAVVDLPADVRISASTFPGGSTHGNLVFLRASGEVKNYTSGQDYVELTNGSSNTTQRIRVNALGVVVEGI
jgi:prepilin-type N-terminal cleavage/methylation domain-containing protein